MEEKYLSAIDLGTSKTAISVARLEGKNIQVIYYRQYPSKGIQYSAVRNAVQAAGPLKEMLEEASRELGIPISQAVVGLPRYPVVQVSDRGQYERPDEDAEITREEVEGLKTSALENYPLNDPKNEAIYGATAQSFSNGESIGLLEDEIVGMSGEQLQGNFKIFIGQRSPAKNIDRLFERVGIAMTQAYFTPDCAARAVLTEEEKENGVALVELGAGVTSVTVYQKKILRHYAAIPFGGQTVTGDIRTECGIDARLAEEIKLGYGVCMPDKLVNLSDKILQIENENGVSQMAVRYLSETITARIREIFEAVCYIIQESGYADKLRSGIVLTGGGANLTNTRKYLAELSGYKVHYGLPRQTAFTAPNITGVWNPEASTVIGLLLKAVDDNLPGCTLIREDKEEWENRTVEVPGDWTIGSESGEAPQDGPTGGVEDNRPEAVENTAGESGTQEEHPREDGQLISPEDFGPEQPKEKPKKGGRRNITWLQKVKDKVIGIGTTVIDFVSDTQTEGENAENV